MVRLKYYGKGLENLEVQFQADLVFRWESKSASVLNWNMYIQYCLV